MKIAYVAPQPIPSKAANSIHMMKMAQAMAHNGHEVTLFCPQGDKALTDGANIFAYYGVEENFKILSFNKYDNRIGLARYALRNAGAARQMKTDFLFSRCLMSAWVAELSGIPVLFELHESPKALGAIARRIFSRVICHKNLSAIIVISQSLKNHLVQDYGVPASKIIVAPDGADPLPSASSMAFPKPEGSFHAGYAGHLYQGRGTDIIIAAARAIPDVTFHIVGGTDDDIIFWKNEAANIQNIIFHGHVPPKRVPDFLQSFDVLLAPYQNKISYHGNASDISSWISPLKLFEYMATGKPIICSDLPVLREIVRADENALLCVPDHVQAWISAINFLKNNPQDAARLGQTAKDEFTTRYTWRKRAEMILKEAGARR